MSYNYQFRYLCIINHEIVFQNCQVKWLNNIPVATNSVLLAMKYQNLNDKL